MNIKTSICIFLFSVMIGELSLAQSFTPDDFSSFSHPDRWFGDVGVFQNSSSGVLQLADSVGNDAQIFRLSSQWDNAIWRFRVNFDFMPSSSNHAVFAVGMQQTNIYADNRGYFVRIGGGTQRRISFMRRNGMSNSTLFESPPQFLQSSIVDILIELERSQSGLWTLRCDTGSGWIHLGSIIENSLEPGPYIGWICRYTATRADKITLSQLEYSGDCRFSNGSFAISRVELKQQDIAILHLNKPPKFSSVFSSMNLLPGFSNLSFHYLRDQPFEVLVQFDTSSIPINTEVFQHFMGLTSFDSTESIDTLLVFFYFLPNIGDIVINELMIDPSPAVAHLPETEYIELRNNTSWKLDISSWQIQTGNTLRTIPNGWIDPGSYILLIRQEDAWQYSDSLACVSMEWGVNVLPNSGGEVVLFSPSGMLVDQVSYATSWYGESTKSQGGWSLERRQFDVLCNDAVNWSASASLHGATPGRMNSLEPNSKSLQLSRKGLVAKRFGELAFNLDIANYKDLRVYVINESVDFFQFSSRILRLDLGKWLEEGRQLEVRITGLISDCLGNVWGDTIINFALPFELLPGQIVINEIVPAPYSEGSSYVEIFNKSGKWLDLQSIQLARYDGHVFDARRIIDSSFLLEPDAFLVFTPHPDRISRDYPHCNAQCLFPVGLPSLPNESGGIAVLDAQGTLLDSMMYASSFHSPFIQNTRGVALERVSPKTESLLPTNWRSATSLVGWGTPGLTNSNLVQFIDSEKSFVLNPEVFSPNRFQLLEAHFEFDRPGGRGEFRVSEITGAEIYSESQTLTKRGCFTWDGRSKRGEYAKAGLYIATLEVVFPDGTRKIYKDAFAIVH